MSVYKSYVMEPANGSLFSDSEIRQAVITALGLPYDYPQDITIADPQDPTDPGEWEAGLGGTTASGTWYVDGPMIGIDIQLHNGTEPQA